jgi:hypothetical protein
MPRLARAILLLVLIYLPVFFVGFAVDTREALPLSKWAETVFIFVTAAFAIAFAISSCLAVILFVVELPGSAGPELSRARDFILKIVEAL